MKKLNRTKSTIWARAAVTALCAVLTTAASWANRQWTSNECVVTLDDNGTLTVSKSGGSGRMADYGYDEYDNFTVPEWHQYYIDIRNIVISEGVTAIGSAAFYECAARSVTIPQSVTYIGDEAFLDCVETGDVFCYADPALLTWVDKGDDFIRLSAKATRCHVYEEDLTEFQSKFGHVNVTFIGDLRNYTGPWKSGDCTVTLDDNGTMTVTKNEGSGDGRMADYQSTYAPWIRYLDDPHIRKVVIGDGVTHIGTSAFNACYYLESVVMSDDVTSIGTAAFHKCLILHSFVIPESVTTIGQDAFLGCVNLEDVYCYADPEKLSWNDFGRDDFKPDKGTNCHVKGSLLTLFKAKFSKGAATDVNVTFVGDLEDNPEDGLAIDAKNFPDAKFRQFLHDFEMNNGDDYLSDAELSLIVSLNVSGLGIGDLTGLVFFPRLRTLDCSNNLLATLDVTKNDRLEELYCQSNQLTTLDLSGNQLLSSLDCSLNRISAEGMKALISSLHYRKSSFIAINLDSPDEQNVVSRGNVLAAQEKKWTINCIKDGVEMAYEGGDVSESWVSGDCTVTLTGDGTLIVEGDGYMASYSNSNYVPWYDVRLAVKTIIINKGVRNIGNWAFNSSSNLTSVIISQGVGTIDRFAFYDCSSLKEVRLPASIQSIGEDAFYGCNAVDEVYYYGNPEELGWKEVGCDDFKPRKATVCHVRNGYLEKCQSEFGEVNVTFVDDLEGKGSGDVSSDGKLDGEDVSLLIGWITGKISYEHFKYLDLEDADQNNDYRINIVDVVRLINKIAQQ